MTSAITTTNISTTFPTPGVDNDTQGFRTNFSEIVNQLETAKSEISGVQVVQSNLLRYASSIPAASTGTSGDLHGTIYATTNTLYICFQDYVNTATSIWGKVSLDSASW
jgi:hypothetical protein